MPSIRDYQPDGLRERAVQLGGAAVHFVANLWDMAWPLRKRQIIRHPQVALTVTNLPEFRNMIANMRRAWVDSTQQRILYRSDKGVPNKSVTLKHHGPSITGGRILQYLLDRYDEYNGRLDPESEPIMVETVEYRINGAVYHAVSFTLSLETPALARKYASFSYFRISVAERKALGQLLSDSLAVLLRPFKRMLASILRRSLGNGPAWSAVMEIPVTRPD